LLAEVVRLANQGVTPAELAKIKTQVLTQALLSRQTPEGLASAVAEAAVLEGNPEQVNQGLADLQRVSAADVKRVMRKYIASAHQVTVEYTQEGGAK
jgi:zinc protease